MMSNEIPANYFPYPPQAPVAYRLNLHKLFGDVWNLYKRNFGKMVILSLIILGIAGGFPQVMAVIQIALKQAGLWEASIVVRILGQLILFIISIWLGLGVQQIILFAARSGEVRYSLLFPSLEKFLKGFYVSIIMMFVIYLPLLFVGGIAAAVWFFLGEPEIFAQLVWGYIQLSFGGNPEVFAQAVQQIDNAAITMLIVSGLLGFVYLLYVIYITIRVSVTYLFIIDRNDDVFVSLGNSWTVTRKNVLRLFAGFLVLGLWAMSGILLCCVGIILTYAIAFVGPVLAYLQMTGQPNICDYQRSV